jgi:hypothetical protein
MLLRLNIRSELRMFPVSLQTRRPLVLGLCWIKPCGHELLGPTDSESGLRLAGFSFIQGDLIPVSWFGDSRSTYRCPTYLSKRVPWTFTKHFCPFNVKILGLVIFLMLMSMCQQSISETANQGLCPHARSRAFGVPRLAFPAAARPASQPSESS